jgi:hypothetical protein
VISDCGAEVKITRRTRALRIRAEPGTHSTTPAAIEQASPGKGPIHRRASVRRTPSTNNTRSGSAIAAGSIGFQLLADISMSVSSLALLASSGPPSEASRLAP